VPSTDSRDFRQRRASIEKASATGEAARMVGGRRPSIPTTSSRSVGKLHSQCLICRIFLFLVRVLAGSKN
jgi:hypothetical protein